MQVILFRPRHRQEWIDRLREKGWVVRVVHEAHKVKGTFVILDAADGSWEKFVPVFVRKKMTVWLLSDEDLPQDKWPPLGISKVIATTDELEWEERDPTQTKAPPSLFEEDLVSTEPMPLSQRIQRGETQEEVHGKEERSETSTYIHEAIWKSEEKALEHPAPSVSSVSLPRFPSVLSVYGAKGGIGKTVFLLHLAAILSSYVRSVCILDMDTMHGTIASTLNLRPKRTLPDLIRRIEDRKASLACLHQTERGFFIVAAPPDIRNVALSQEQVLHLMRFLKSEMEVVLIDMSTAFDALTKQVMEQSEQLLLMTTDEVASIHSLERMKPFLGSLRPSPEIFTVWNRCRGEDVSKESLRDRLSWPRILELPEDEAVSKAIRRGMCSFSGPYHGQIKDFVERWLGIEKAPAPKRKWLTRLLSERF